MCRGEMHWCGEVVNISVVLSAQRGTISVGAWTWTAVSAWRTASTAAAVWTGLNTIFTRSTQMNHLIITALVSAGNPLPATEEPVGGFVEVWRQATIWANLNTVAVWETSHFKSLSHTHLLPLMRWRLRWQRLRSHPNTQTFPIRTIFSGSLSMNSMNSSVVSFFQDLGCIISQVSGDLREASYLFQLIAVTIQRFNSVLFRESFVAHKSQDDSDA